MRFVMRVKNNTARLATSSLLRGQQISGRLWLSVGPAAIKPISFAGGR
jgi:hypothetical protein